MPLVSRENLDYKRYWLHYFFLTLKCSFYKKGYITFVVIFSYILYVIFSTIGIRLSKKIPQMQKKRVGVKLKFVYMRVILEMFLNLQFLQNN